MWTSPTPVAETLGYSKILYTPLVDERGDLHLVWHNDLGVSEEQPYRLMYSRFNGETWSSEEEVYRTKNSSVQAMPHRDLTGDIYISLLDGGYSTIAYQLEADGSSWMTSDPINPGHITQWTWPDMMGGIHFFGSDYQNKMYYSYWRDGHFLVQNWQTSGTISGRQTQLDGQNNLHTFWTDSVPIPGGTVRGLYYQCLQSDHTWASEKVLSGNNYVLGLPIKAANTNSEIALTWEEKDMDSFVLRRWRKCEMISQQSVPSLLPTSQTLQTMALSNQPHRLCVVAKQDFTQIYSVVCAKLLD